jgi:amicyanin
MKFILIAVIAAIALGVGGYSARERGDQVAPATGSGAQPVAENSATGNDGAAPATPQTRAETSASVTVAPQPTAASVSISGFAFGPATLTVKKGATVTWTNRDTAPHTVTSDSGSVLGSDTLKTGQSYSATFTEAGTFSYHCAFHPMMKATIVVEG